MAELNALDHQADASTPSFTSVYGPVDSWRFGRSLGIDPIGTLSVCSFSCVYCQLGAIQRSTCQRQVFVPTEQVIQDLQGFAPWDVDAITFSGSGEPTLAFNLGDLLGAVADITHRPTVVLTNSTLMMDPQVHRDLSLAETVCAKLDAVQDDQFQRINRPAVGIHLVDVLAGLDCFRQNYSGHLAIQTMLLLPWDTEAQDRYIHQMQRIQPDEIQLNTPTRPRSLGRHLEARGNHTQDPDYAAHLIKTVQPQVLETFAQRLRDALNIPVRCVPQDDTQSHQQCQPAAPTETPGAGPLA